MAWHGLMRGLLWAYLGWPPGLMPNSCNMCVAFVQCVRPDKLIMITKAHITSHMNVLCVAKENKDCVQSDVLISRKDPVARRELEVAA